MGRFLRPDGEATAPLKMMVPSAVAAVMIPGCPDRNLARENLTDPSRRLTVRMLTPLAVTLPMPHPHQGDLPGDQPGEECEAADGHGGPFGQAQGQGDIATDPGPDHGPGGGIVRPT